MAKTKGPTPMMKQYLEVKAKLAANTLLFFRLGDFYEMFGEDAVIASNILGLTLTARGDKEMAGIPFHSADGYIRRLLEAGKKVAICDQMEEAKPGKLVKRGLTRVYSAGTALNSEHLEEKRNCYLLSVNQLSDVYTASYMELSTGQWGVVRSRSREDFLTALIFLNPTELLVPEDNPLLGVKGYLLENLPELSVTEGPSSFFEPSSAHRVICEALGVASLKAFGLDADHPCIGAAGALYQYASQALCGKPSNLYAISEQPLENSMMVDPSTARQLELFLTTDGSKEGSLRQALDTTVTAAGSRQLEKVMQHPLCDTVVLNQRYAAIAAFKDAPAQLSEFRSTLKNARDLQRILGRLQNRLRTPRELIATRQTLRTLPALRATLQAFPDSDAFSFFLKDLGTHDELCTLLGEALDEEANADLSKGGYIRPGYDSRLDELKNMAANHKVWLADFEKAQQQRTGIKSLKVKYNGNFGFFIEVTKANLDKVPDDYIRRSTTVSGERYVTEELNTRQKEILSAETNAVRRELEIFENLVEATLNQAEGLRATADSLAWADLMAAFAHNAQSWGYTRPSIDDSTLLKIEQGRHPVVEQALAKDDAGESFIPNDAHLSSDQQQLVVITGPNMAGKSTYIRQVALIVYLAQIGSFVPASRAHIGLVDRLFSRIGASDALHRGESTFMVEMTQTAYILRSATPRSLIVLDEIGRGTSTYDGLSIAWAVAEYLHAHPTQGARTLFATHYHELTRLAQTHSRVRNYTVSVKEHAGKIVFVRQVIPGTADRSYGVHVAEIAGMPKEVVARAGTLLEGLESSAKAPKSKSAKENEAQLGLF